MTTSPGFSSRSSVHITKQFPQKDELMSEMEQEAGWSNSEPVEGIAEDVTPEVQTPEELEPGFSNAKAVKSDEPVNEPTGDDGAAPDEPTKPAKKTAAKKTAKKG